MNDDEGKYARGLAWDGRALWFVDVDDPRPITPETEETEEPEKPLEEGGENVHMA